MSEPLPIVEFMKLQRQCPILDVRTPAEFAKGHIPGAINLPLFSNEERAEIGTLYKRESREAAILRGLDFVGPRLRSMIETVETDYPLSDKKRLGLYCWRGGMRSQCVAWLLRLYGYQPDTLEGGYKAFRRYILDVFEQPRLLTVLGGKTGSGKTDILEALQAQGQQVINLEKLARHKGSAFGGLGQPPQPTQQQFENELGLQWLALSPEQPVWIEDESRYIGHCTIPDALWQAMEQSPTIFVDVPLALRVERLVAEYGQQDRANLAAAVHKIKKRLGGQQAKTALAALERGDLEICCTILLERYYDKAYLYDLAQKRPDGIRHIEITSEYPAENAAKVLEAMPL